MKRITLLVLLLLVVSIPATHARNGYRIQVKFTELKDTMVYLAHYYGKPLPTIYKTDSARFDKKGVAILESKDETLGGIYMLLLSDKQTYFEFLLNNGDEMSITASTQNLPESVKFNGSPENERFQAYVTFLREFGARQQTMQQSLENAETAADSAQIREQITAHGKKLIAYRKDYAQQYPNTLLANIFRALEVPQIPEGTHYLPDGNVDSSFAYKYYKAHYWDGFDFTDDRLIHTPIYDGKLDEYFNKIVVPVPDSVTREGDSLLAKTRGRKELFKYTLWWLARNTESSKIMGMDQAFVYFVEQYILRGDAYWLDHEGVERYRERISKIAPNIIGNLAPEIIMEEYKTGERVALSSIQAKYTLLFFWDPTCGHCTKEAPKIDSLYKAVLKDKGVKVYAVRTEGPVEKWQEFLKEHGINDWIHVYDPEHKSDYRSKYDVYSTPVLYLLDENKIIRGKRLDHSNILDVIGMLEKKEKAAKTN
jgi:peroxiredoxin